MEKEGTEWSNIEYLLSIKEYAIFAYNEEKRREETIKQQATTMQAAFSFVSASIVMSMPVIFQYANAYQHLYFALVFSSILIGLGVSLVYATVALKLITGEGCSPILEHQAYIEEQVGMKQEAQLEYWISFYDTLHLSKRKDADERIKYLNRSRMAFILSLSLCGFWFILFLILCLIY